MSAASTHASRDMGYPHGTDHGLRDRRDEKLQRAVGAIESGRAATVVASDTGRKRRRRTDYPSR